MTAQITTTAINTDLRELINSARGRVSAAVNAELSQLYWRIGARINAEVLGGARANYGAAVVDQLGAQLSAEFGRGFTAKNLRRMMQFAELFPISSIVVSLIRQLSWTHFLRILPIKDSTARAFYAQMAVEQRWSVRELRAQIDRKCYERTQLASPNADLSDAVTELREHGTLSPALLFQDPYLLDFLGLHAGYLEADLEQAILRELEQFILALGRGFAFVERQKRMVIDGEDFYLDLLFYHRKLKRLVAIELKLGRFKAAHKGQMELYLRWLQRHECLEGEAPPIGLILCAEASREQVELLQLSEDGIQVAEYWTELPSKLALEKHLHQALIDARERMARKQVLERGD